MYEAIFILAMVDAGDSRCAIGALAHPYPRRPADRQAGCIRPERSRESRWSITYRASR
jgi:hypothetical protein